MRTTLGLAGMLVLIFALSYCGSTSASSDPCKPAEPDGTNGGTATLALTVSDTAFSPTILKSDNLATVTLTLTNTGTKPHGLFVECMPTPNSNGCPTLSCFPDASVIQPIGPDASATTTFVSPNPEGIYNFGSSAPGDTMAGQFIVQ